MEDRQVQKVCLTDEATPRSFGELIAPAMVDGPAGIAVSVVRHPAIAADAFEEGRADRGIAGGGVGRARALPFTAASAFA